MLNNLKSISVNARLLSAMSAAISPQDGRAYLRNIYVRNHPETGIELVATDGHIALIGYDPDGAIDIINPDRPASFFKFHVDGKGTLSKTPNDLLRKVQSLAKKKGDEGNTMIFFEQSEDHILKLDHNTRIGILDVAPGMSGDGAEQWSDPFYNVLRSINGGDLNYDKRLEPGGTIPHFSSYTLSKLSEIQTYIPHTAIGFVLRGRNDKETGNVQECEFAMLSFSTAYNEKWRIFGLIMPIRMDKQDFASLDYESDVAARFRNGDKQPEQTATGNEQTATGNEQTATGNEQTAKPPEQSETETELESDAEQSIPPALDPAKL